MLSLKKEREYWKNWSESVHCYVEKFVKPRNLNELLSIVQKCYNENKNIRVVGAGHSFTPLSATSDVLVSLDKLSGIDEIDTENHSATVWGGTRLKDLGEQLYFNGFAMENLGDINAQSIAGAISTGTHGTGMEFGNISTQIIGLTIVTAIGEIIEVTNSEQELLQAAKVSLGLLGIIVKVKLKVVPAYRLIGHSYRLSFENCITQMDQLKKANRNFEFYWFPYTKTVQVKIMNLYEGQQHQSSARQNAFKKVVIENGLFWALSEISRKLPGTAKTVSTISALGVPVGSEIAQSHHLYATPRLIKFHEMEYCIPEEVIGDVLRDIDHMIHKKKFAVHFPIECRFVKKDDIWLSPSYERNSAYIAVHMYKGMDFQDYFSTIEEVFQYYNGRPHWGKMHTMEFEKLIQTYPRLEDFLTVRNKLDENSLFVNSYLKSLFQ